MNEYDLHSFSPPPSSGSTRSHLDVTVEATINPNLGSQKRPADQQSSFIFIPNANPTPANQQPRRSCNISFLLCSQLHRKDLCDIVFLTFLQNPPPYISRRGEPCNLNRFATSSKKVAQFGQPEIGLVFSWSKKSGSEK